MPRTILGSLVGAVALMVLAAPSAFAAGPADVTVRVEGPSGTLVSTALRTTRTPVVKDGTHSCTGTSAAGALQQATDGAWKASWFDGLGYAVNSIDGVTPRTPDYWTIWLNDRSSTTGLCDTELQNGDAVLLFVCSDAQPPSYACGDRPLGLIVPRGKATAPTVRVVTFADDGSTAPAAGATVTGGTKAVKTDAKGNAKVTLAGGESTLRATRSGDVPSATVFCAAERCGSSDTTGPRLSTQIRAGQVFSSAKAPRKLSGTAIGLSGGIVELRLARRFDGRCSAYVGRIEDFVKCPRRGAPWFQAADRERWSYLLPARLPAGGYTLGVLASDAAGNVSETSVRFTVQAAK